MIGPVVYRIWDLGSAEGTKGASRRRLKHIIEPSISYRYESPTVTQTKWCPRNPFYRYHELTYG